jgi:alpha-D-xyloside xylohydrolase
VKEYVEQQVSEPMTIIVYPGADGAVTMYEDDGKSFDYHKGEFMRMAMTWRDSNRTLFLRLAPGSRMLPPAKRSMQVRLAGSKDTKAVMFEGKPLHVKL